MTDTLTKYPRAWCPTCKAIQDTKLSEMQAGGQNDHAAADLLCVVCYTIIATLYAR